jgi:hypothetical protein
VPRSSLDPVAHGETEDKLWKKMGEICPQWKNKSKNASVLSISRKHAENKEKLDLRNLLKADKRKFFICPWFKRRSGSCNRNKFGKKL